MSTYSLQIEGVPVPPEVEAQGPIAVVAHVKAANPDPAVHAALDATLAEHEAMHPARAAAERAAFDATLADPAEET